MENEIFTFTNFYYIYYVLWLIVNIFAAVWLYRDAKKLPSLFINSKPIWWAFAAVVIGGVWVVLVYWVIHHSTISNRINEKI